MRNKVLPLFVVIFYFCTANMEISDAQFCDVMSTVDYLIPQDISVRCSTLFQLLDGGHIEGRINGYETCRIEILGGYIRDGIYLYDGEAIVSGGDVGKVFSAGNFSHATISGGTIGRVLVAHAYSQVNGAGRV